MTNIDKISVALSEWAFKVAKSVLPQVSIPVGGKLGGLMQIIGVNPATYNIWNELGFLAEPIIQTMVTPAVGRMLAGIPDEQVVELAYKYVDAFIAQAKDKGSVNLFGIEVDVDDLQGLRSMLDKQFNR
jgi:hypothetical protein